ncbi:MAG: ATPase, T2SS/T4P/T4SS family [Myxococcales bacterium]|nr:ATPase, T2SS/T4P/T4SS family [Myxococcales bacterium]
MSGMPQLAFDVRAVDGTTSRKLVPADGRIWFGRDGSCQLVLGDSTVSRRHGWVALSSSGLTVGDESSNGILVNGQRLHRSQLRAKPGVAIQVGPFSIRATIAGASSRERKRSGSHRSERSDARESRSGKSSPAAEESRKGAGSKASAWHSASLLGGVTVAMRRAIHRRLLDHLDLAQMDRSTMDPKIMRPRVEEALERIIAEMPQKSVPHGAGRAQLIKELTDEAVGFGPLEPLLEDDSVSEVMVVDPYTIFYEQSGRLKESEARFTDNDSVRAVIERIVTPLGRRIDESSPLVDARLPDGSRVNAVIPPLALRGPCITIRKFPKNRLTMDQLIQFGAFTQQMGRFLDRCVRVRKNVVISGGTGSGKTTLLNVLSASIPDTERIVTVEDAAELSLAQNHVVGLESRPPNMEGKGAYTIRDLVRNALRMRPDRIVVGECRGGEAIDMLQAMNTGHEGSMTTTHANSPREALARLETLCLMAGLDLPIRAIRQQIASSVHLIVQQTRFSDGSRRVTAVAEVGEVDDHGEIIVNDIFRFERSGTGHDGKIVGEFMPTGIMPTFIDDFISHGLANDGDFI